MPYYKVTEENGTKKLKDYSKPSVVMPSYIGMLDISTTNSTLAKVQAIYGADTTWIQHSGYVLRGATSGVTPNDATKTGGSDTHTLTIDEMPSHNHGGATGGMNRNNPHAHPQANYQGTSGFFGVVDSGTASSSGRPNTFTTDINHEHSISAQGGGQAFSVLENYKSVYIWERTA